MISGINVENFKGFRDLRLAGLGSFHVLVGPNGSGKSSFFEILEFVKDLLSLEIQEAVGRRTVRSLRELGFRGSPFPVTLQVALDAPLFSGEPAIYWIQLNGLSEAGVRIGSEYLHKSSLDTRPLVERTIDGVSVYVRENEGLPYSSAPATLNLSLPESRTALGQVPADEKLYPTANLVRKLLVRSVHLMTLDNPAMGKPCRRDLSATSLQSDGLNLARVAGRLLKGRENGTALAPNEWINHLRLALEDLDDIVWRQTEDGSAEYLLLRYRDGTEIPGWLASFGTLRTLALTLPAFLPESAPALYLFEEPENGIHPKAIEIVMDAIQSIPNAQTFVTTHSPMIVQQAGVDALLLFSKTAEGEIIVQHGGENPVLSQWDGVPDLATVFASRVLG